MTKLSNLTIRMKVKNNFFFIKRIFTIYVLIYGTISKLDNIMIQTKNNMLQARKKAIQ